MRYNHYHNESTHPEHPVRNVFFCIFCFFFALSFSYLWVWNVFDFEYTWLMIVIAVAILLSAVIGGIVSFKKSHRGYFAYRRNSKRYR